MTSLSDLLSGIRERVSNPLIFSFIISWLIFNWQIPTALFFVDAQEIRVHGFNSVFELVANRLSDRASWLTPLGAAFIYTLVFPFLRNIINAFNAWTTKWGNTWVFGISKSSNVSTEKYLNLKLQYERRTELLEKAIASETEVSTTNSNLQTQILEERVKNNELLAEKNKFEEFYKIASDSGMLNGRWEVKFKYPDGRTGSEIALIQNGRYDIVGQFGETTKVAIITNYFYDNRNGKVFFVKEFNKEGTNYVKAVGSNDLRLLGNGQLVGTENRDIAIEYNKIANY
jgi:hypothetical protein